MSLAQIGPYRIERLLGTGSFATVWLGHDPSLGARVAIKVLAENWSHDLRVRERFLDEARLLWRLDHDRIVRVYSLGELSDGRPYLVMAWADGGSLRDRLAAGPMPVAASLRLLSEISAGVAVLHEHGIVHRDLTPGNVLFRSRPAGAGRPEISEQVVIADLGLAKALAAASGLTARAGTPGYMAPEQDDPLAVVDPRADVYGLGRLGVRLLGEPVDARSRTEIRLRQTVPRKVADVLRQATAQRPADRYSDAAAFATALRKAAAVPPAGSAAEQAETRTTAARPLRRMVAAVLLVMTLFAATASDAAGGSRAGAAGQITVVPPTGWHAVRGEWRVPGGGLEPALVMSATPDRWSRDPAVPGAFVGLSGDGTAPSTAAAFVAARPHAGCTAAPVRISRQAGIDWVVARYTACPGVPREIVEAAGAGPGDAGLVYVQVAPPVGSEPGFVDALLAGIGVR